MPTSFVTAAVGGMSLATYTDADQISSYATTAMQWANENGLIIGGHGHHARTAWHRDPCRGLQTILMRFCEDVLK